MCLHQATAAAPITPPSTMLPPGMSGPVGAPADPNVPGLPPGAINPGIQTDQTPQAAQVNAPTKIARALEIASGGAYDPTGGVDQGKAPSDASGSMKPTKFGALMKIIRPMMEGATVGGFMGKSTPGGGFGAATNMFMQRRLMQLQQSQFLAQMMKLSSEVAKNNAEAQWAQRRPMVTRTAPAIKGYDDQGNPVFMSQNPQTGTFEPVEGIRPESQDKIVDTDEGGLVRYDPADRRAGAIPLTLSPRVGSAADAKNDPTSGSVASASEPSERTQGGIPRRMFSGQPKQPSAHDSGSPYLPNSGAFSTAPSASPSAINAGAIPRQLHAAGYSKQKPMRVTNRDATGNETDDLVDENPDSPTYGQTVKGGVATRAPRPDRGVDRKASQAETAADVETYAGEALKRNGNDAGKAIEFLNNLNVGDPDAQERLQSLLPKIRASIRDRVKPGRPKAKNSSGDWQQQLPSEQPQPHNNN